MTDNLKQMPGLPNYYLTSEGNAVKQEPSWWDKVKSYGKAALDVINEEAPYFIPGISTYKFAEDAGNNFNTAIQQVKDGDYNAIASTATGLGNTLMGVVSLAPFIGGGVKVATKLANNFNRAQKAARTQIVAKAFDNQVKSTIPKITVPEVNPIIYTPSTNTSKTSLAFLERPSKLTLREKIGAPKGTKVYTPEENVAFRQQINDFAQKYGYEPIGQETTDPEVLERYARSLIKRHNTFYRGVSLPQKGTKQWAQLENALGKNFTEQQALKYMATNPPGGGAGEVYLSPFSNTAGFYGNQVEVTRPFKLGTDRTKWFEEGDFSLVDNQGHRDLKFYKDFKGLTDPWNSGYLGKAKVSNLSKEDAQSLYKLSDYVSSSENIPNEVTARNQQLIPQRITYLTKPGSKDWATPDITFTGSKKVADTPWQFTDISDINPYENLNFYRLIEGLPIIKDGKVLLGKEGQGFVNFTTDVPFRLHRKYRHVPGGELMIINGGNLQGKTPISIEPMDSFFLNDIQLNPNQITIATGNKDLLKQGKELGFNMVTSKKLQENYPTKQIQIGKFTKTGFGNREGAREYKHLLDEFVTKTFGRPALSDYQILENKTGLKAGVEKYTNQLDEISKLNSIFETTPAQQLPTYSVYTLPNKRELGVMNIMYPSYRDQLNFKNVFYDPVTHIESDLAKKLGVSQHPKNSEELVKAFKDYIKINSIKPLSTGGTLYPFSFSKIPYIKTPVVRYEDGEN